MSKSIMNGLGYNQGSELMQVLQKAGLGSSEAQDVITGGQFRVADQVVYCMRRGGLECPLTPDEQRAASILGRQRVVSCYEAAERLNVEWPTWEAPPDFFSSALLKKAALENLDGLTDWRVVYTLGFSVQELRKRRMLSTPYGHEGYPFPPAATSGYHLINFKPLLLDDSWDECQHRLMRDERKRVEDTVLVEALFLLHAIYGIRPLEGLMHWGVTKVPYSDPTIWVVAQSNYDVELKAWHRCHKKNLGVVVELPANSPGTVVPKIQMTVERCGGPDWFAAMRELKEFSEHMPTPDGAVENLLLKRKRLGYPFRRRDYIIKQEEEKV